MIHSYYILNILDLSFDDHPEAELLKEQVSCLTVSDTEHTGVGLFINFCHDPHIQDYKTRNTNGKVRISGVEIISESEGILADATVHLEHGAISCLEIWNKTNNPYPLAEPEHYELHQTWRSPEHKRSFIPISTKAKPVYGRIHQIPGRL